MDKGANTANPGNAEPVKEVKDVKDVKETGGAKENQESKESKEQAMRAVFQKLGGAAITANEISGVDNKAENAGGESALENAVNENAESAQNNNGDVSILLEKREESDVDNAVRLAVEQKMQNGKLEKVVTALSNAAPYASVFFGKAAVMVGTVAKPIMMAANRLKAENAVRKTGQLESAFTALGLDPMMDKLENQKDGELQESATLRRARRALEEGAFDGDKLTSEESLVLYGDEKIEKNKESSDLNKKITELYKNINEAGDDPEKIKKLKEEFSDELVKMQGGKERNDTLASKFTDSTVMRYLFGNKFSKNTDRIEYKQLESIADGVEELARDHDVTNEEFEEYVDKHVSFFNAELREGADTERKADSLMRAIEVGGAAGGVLYALATREARTAGRGGLGSKFAEALGGNMMAAMGISGAVVGGAFGVARGAAKANRKIYDIEAAAGISTSEVESAEKAEDADKTEDTSAEEANGESDDAKNAENADAEKESATDDKNAENENAEKETSEGETKQKTSLFQKLHQFKQRMTGEDLFRQAIEREDLRIDAPELTKELQDLLKNPDADGNAEAILEKLAQARAYSNMAAKKKFAFVKYRKGTEKVDRDNLAEQMLEAAKVVDKEKLKEAVKAQEGQLDKKFEEIKSAERKFKKLNILWSAVGGAVMGGALGSAGAVAREWYQSDKSAGVREFVGAKVLAVKEMFGIGDNDASDVVQNTGDTTSNTQLAEQAETAGATDTNVAGNGNLLNTRLETTDGVEYNPHGQIEVLTDADGDGTYGLSIGGKTVISGLDGEGIVFDQETGALTKESLELLASKGIEINTTGETAEVRGALSIEKLSDYFKISDVNENYVAQNELNFSAENGNYAAGYTFTDVKVDGYVASEGANRAADLVNIHSTEDGILMRVQAVGSDVIKTPADMDDLKVVFSPGGELGGEAFIVDVDRNGNVEIPADSPLAAMFADGHNFGGGAMQIVRDSGSGDGFEVLSSMSGTGAVTEISYLGAEVEAPVYQIGGSGGDTLSMRDMPNVDELSGRGGNLAETFGRGTTNYADANAEGYGGNLTHADTGEPYAATVNGIKSDSTEDTLNFAERTEGYRADRDPANHLDRAREAYRGPDLVRQLLEENVEGTNVDAMTDEQASNALLAAVESGDITTQELLNAQLDEICDSPEQMVEFRATLGDLMYDITPEDGIDNPVLIDEDWKVNELANLLRDDERAYIDFANELRGNLAEKLDGGEIELVVYAEDPYNHTSFSYKLGDDTRTAYQLKTTKCVGIGTRLLDKDKNLIQDEAVVRKLMHLNNNENLDDVSWRLNCDQLTAKTSTPEKITDEITKKDENEGTRKAEEDTDEKDENENTGKDENENTDKDTDDDGTTSKTDDTPDGETDINTTPDGTTAKVTNEGTRSKVENENTNPGKPENENTNPGKPENENTKPENETTGTVPKTANTHAGDNGQQLGNTAAVVAENDIAFQEIEGSENDRTPGSEILNRQANIAEEGAVRDAEGNPLTDSNGNTYIDNGNKTAEEVQTSIENGTQTTYNASTAGRDANASSDVAAAVNANGGTVDNAADRARRAAEEAARRAAEESATASIPTTGNRTNLDGNEEESRRVFNDILSNPDNGVSQNIESGGTGAGGAGR